MALKEVAGSLSRTGVAVAALGMALTAMIGVASWWRASASRCATGCMQSMHADVYVSAPGPSGNLSRRLDPGSCGAAGESLAYLRTARRAAPWLIPRAARSS